VSFDVPVVAGPELVGPGLGDRLGRPGQPPYTRGIHEDMYRARRWTVRQLAGFGNAADTNTRLRFLLDRGATGINCVFDYPSLRAFDSDDCRAVPDVGRGGVAVDVAADFDELFVDIPLDEVSVSLVSSQPIGAVPHLAMFLTSAARRGIPWSELRGTSQNDFLMETCITIGPDALGPAEAFRLECDLAEFCIDAVPRWNPVSVAAYNYREAGADAVLEVALAIAHGRAVAEELVRRGVDADRAARCVTFFFSAHINLFQEVAKFRAARRLWHRVASEQLGCRDPRSTRLRFHAQTAGTTFTGHHPLANIARGAVEGLAAIAGGAQSLHVNAFDEAFAIPTEQSATLALCTQQLLLDEAAVAESADPFGGSYLVEHLTDQLETHVEDTLATIDDMGGIVDITEAGWLHRELGRRAYEQHVAVEPASQPPTDADEPRFETFALPTDTAAAQRERLRQARQSRDSVEVTRLLDALVTEATTGRVVMPATIQAVAAGATIGEIGTALRKSCGTWTIPLS
jgi:methylmalonyl-CoA mutase, N-terminal domain